MDLDSCFGPLGRSRIVCNASGGAIIAKDSQLLLPHYVDDVSDGFERFVCQESMKAASRWGDGLNSSLILTRSFTAQLSAEINSGGSESTRQRKRSRLLYAVQAVRSACAQSRDDIRLCMIECNLWHVESSVEKWISSICRSTAHPSTNAAIAEHVASLMARWMLEDAGEADVLSELGERGRSRLATFDTLVHASLRQDRSSSGQEVLEITSDLVLRGRCRDYSALGGDVRFICAETLIAQSYDYQHTIRVSSTDALCEQNLVGSVTLQRSAEALQRRGISVIICTDTVQDEAQNILSRCGVYTIDQVPKEYLTYISARCGVPVLSFVGEVLRGTSISGRFSRMDYRGLGGSEVYCILRGVTLSDQPKAPGQLIVHAASTMSSGVYTRILKRCLRVISAAVANATSSTSSTSRIPSTSSATSATFGYSPTSTPALRFTHKSQLTVVPGGGAGEMGWAILWSEVALRLGSHIQTGEGGALGRGVFAQRANKVLTLVADRLAAQLRTLLMPECIFLCNAISHAYLCLPRVILASSAALVVFPGEPSVSETRARVGGNLERLLLQWRRVFTHSVHPGDWGRSGVVVNDTADMESFCAIDDAIARGLYCSGAQFWNIFDHSLDICQIYLRIGGSTGIIPIRRKKPPAEQEEQSL